MTLEGYCLFLTALEKRLKWVGDVPFGPFRPFFYASLPRFVMYDGVDAKKAARMLWEGALGVAYPCREGSRVVTFLKAYRGAYDLKSLHSSKRNQTRRGLENCEVKRVDWEQMRTRGLDINRSALKRQGRRSSGLSSGRWWDRQCRVSSRFSDVLAWGCFVDGELTGYVHVMLHDGVPEGDGVARAASVAHFMTDSRHLRSYPNEALIFTATKALLEEFGCSYVLLGTSSDDPRLSAWKRHMGFREDPVPFVIMINPILRMARPFSSKLRAYI
jgi:hypothetical protein